MFIKANVSQEDKLEDIQKKNKDKKVSLFNKNNKSSQSNEKNNTSNNNDLEKKTDPDGRTTIQNSIKGKKERPLYSNNLNTSTTIKNDANKTGIKRNYTISKNSSIDPSKNVNSNNNTSNVSLEKNLNPTSCLSTATNSNTDINSPDMNLLESSKIEAVNGNIINEISDNNNLGINNNEESSNTIITPIDESKEINEVMISVAKEENDQDSENFNKVMSEQSSYSNLLQESNSEKYIDKSLTEEYKINSSNININTDITVKEKICENIIDKNQMEVKREATSKEHSVKPDSSTTTYLKNLMLLEEKMFNILEVFNGLI